MLSIIIYFMKDKWNIKINIIKLLPLLLFYIVIIMIFSSKTFVGDENGYIKIAKHLIGYSNSPDNISLWWGPGYPIILTPFIFFKIPWIWARLLNALFLFSAIIYFHKTLTFWLSNVHATIFTYLLGMYPPFIREIHFLLTENLVFFLICGFIFHFCKTFKTSQSNWKNIMLTSFYLGYLALTKVFFGYVITVGLFSFGLIYLLFRNNNYIKTIYIYLFALIMCLPYLYYTHSITNKNFYWGSSGGMSLYWISTPYKKELGSWFSFRDVQTTQNLAQHKKLFNKIKNLSEIEKDREFKKQALNNIIHHPKRYLINWIANIGRMLFSYPFSYTPQKISTFFYLIPNMFIVVLFILGIYPAIIRWNLIPYELKSLLFFLVITFSGTSLISAYDRQFRPLVPILILWICYIYFYILKIRINPKTRIDIGNKIIS